MMLSQYSISSASACAPAAGQVHSFCSVAANLGWNSSCGVVQDAPMLLEKFDKVACQMAMLTELGKPFWKLCSEPKVDHDPSRSSMFAAGRNWSRSKVSPLGAMRV